MKKCIFYFLIFCALLIIISGCKQEETKKSSDYTPEIDADDFVTQIDNEYLPLKPGTILIYEGKTDEGTERIEVEVTNKTKEIQGIDCVVVSDKVYLDGDLIEDTLDWFAQDKDGNVWYFGEDSKEIEEGKVVSTEGSWEAGVDDAQPGIVMKANPKVGDEYRQEYYKGEAEDMGEVLSLDESESVPFGSYDNLLMTKDWTPLEPEVEENKYYAKGIGVILEVMVKGGSERVELIEIKTR